MANDLERARKALQISQNGRKRAEELRDHLQKSMAHLASLNQENSFARKLEAVYGGVK